jgi:hypothetical protein
MGSMRQALRDLLGGIKWRALAVASTLLLVAIAVLAATDAPAAITSIVVGGAAATIALSIVGETLTSVRPRSRPQAPEAPTTPPSKTR